ncbi:hypothetical protein [Pseudomonas aeruginosa]|nr:hypothetical protein [Pseudomonas aeruginosa]
MVSVEEVLQPVGKVLDGVLLLRVGEIAALLQGYPKVPENSL